MQKSQIRIKKAFGKVFIQELDENGKWSKMERSPSLSSPENDPCITDLHNRLIMDGHQPAEVTSSQSTGLEYTETA
ncbi:MAG: hypothetical protein ACOYO1_02440 [Bacteroidales bacterium]